MYEWTDVHFLLMIQIYVILKAAASHLDVFIYFDHHI